MKDTRQRCEGRLMMTLAIVGRCALEAAGITLTGYIVFRGFCAWLWDVCGWYLTATGKPPEEN